MSENIYRLFCEEEPFLNYKKYFYDNKIEFNLNCLPEHFVETYQYEMDRVERLIRKKDDRFYIDMMNSNSEVFKYLQPIKVDKLLLSIYKKLEKHDGNIALLNTFYDGERVEYSRSEIVTGRLSVKSGPKIMNLPKKYRNILMSRFDEGEILMVDYKSLEPRVARYVAGRQAAEDIYQQICDEMDFPVDRVVMKRAVISILYGMGEEASIGELSQDKTRLIREKVLEYFNINYILSLAIKQNASGMYLTHFGRPIHWGADVQLNQVLNGYIQGTAVDVALGGFLEIIKQFTEEMVPLAFIHDAMIVDVSKAAKESFVKIINVGYNCKNLGYFPLNIETISQRKI